MADKTNKTVFVYVASYANLDDAKADYKAVKQLYFNGVIGVYDAAVISKDATGKVNILKTEMPTQYGAWGGLAVGGAGRHILPTVPGVGTRGRRRCGSPDWALLARAVAF